MKQRYLFPEDYMADPAVHVFGGRIYIYPSHDRDSGAAENDNGDHLRCKTTTSFLQTIHDRRSR